MQYSIRKLLLLVTCIGIVVGVGLMLTKTWRRQLGIRQDLKSQGASWVSFTSSELGSVPNVGFYQPITNEIQHYDHLGQVELKLYNVTPQCIKKLSSVRQIDRLCLISCMLSDDDLAYLSDLRVTQLVFLHTNISNESIENIAKVQGVKSIMFIKAPMSPQAVEKLRAKLPDVRILSH